MVITKYGKLFLKKMSRERKGPHTYFLPRKKKGRIQAEKIKSNFKIQIT